MSTDNQQFDRRTQETSSEAYERVKGAAWFKGRRQTLLELIAFEPGLTVDEMTVIYNRKFRTQIPRNELAKCVSHLLHIDQVIRTGVDRICRVKEVLEMTHFWTGQGPVTRQKPPTKKELFKRIQALESENEFLRKKLQIGTQEAFAFTES